MSGLATREKTRLWLLILVGVVATLLGQTHAREIFAPSQPAPGVFAAHTPATTGENYDACRYDAPDSLLAAKNAPHGNSKLSPNEQHRYEIVENSSGDVVKTGISGKPLNQNGTSGRANGQVNKLNAVEGDGTYSARVAETNLQGRQAGLAAEQAATTQLDAAGNSLRLQKRPKP